MTDLDRLMAKRVMGWSLCIEDPDRHHWESEDRIECTADDWHPTTDIAQAMMCLEKFFPYWELLNCNKYIDSYACRGVKPNVHVHAEADTPALAICRAIEKALEAK